MINFDHNWFPFLTKKEYEDFKKFFANSSGTIMPHELSNAIDIDISTAISTLIALSENKISSLLLLIYHDCDPDVPLDAIPFENGFPQLPWHCPGCEEIAENFSELHFDIMAKIKS